MALRGDVGGLEFGLEARALGVKEFEVAEGSTLVGGADEVGGLGGRCEGVTDIGGLLGSMRPDHVARNTAFQPKCIHAEADGLARSFRKRRGSRSRTRPA